MIHSYFDINKVIQTYMIKLSLYYLFQNVFYINDNGDANDGER